MTWTITPQHPRNGWRICKDKRTIAQVWSLDPAHARAIFRALAPDAPLPPELEPNP